MADIPRLTAENILFVIIDLQSKLLATMAQATEVIAANAVLLDAARILGIPAIVTTQYRKGLGELDEAIASRTTGDLLDKTTFSCGADSRFRADLETQGRDWTIISGIETHICVMQTTLDLLRAGRRVAVVADAITARAPTDHQLGLKRMETAGALLISKEMLLYELLGRSDTPAFKQILPLIKQ